MSETTEWAEGLGFKELWISAQSSIPVVRTRKDRHNGYIRPHGFELHGLLESRMIAKTLGSLKITEFRKDLAPEAGMLREVAARFSQCYWSQALKVASTTTFLLLESFYIEPEYRGHGLVKYLLEKALTFYGPSYPGNVLAPKRLSHFHEDVKGSARYLQGTGGVTTSLEKQRVVFASLGFEPTSNPRIFIKTPDKKPPTRYNVLMGDDPLVYVEEVHTTTTN